MNWQKNVSEQKKADQEKHKETQTVYRRQKGMRKMKDYVLEACVDSVESALAAQKGGATRLELCSDLIVGGTTPSPCLFEKIKKEVNIRTHILIRPRFGDFCYTQYETDIMKEEIKMFRNLGAEGIVIGALRSDGSLDLEKMEQFLNEADGMWVTLHRAFDVCIDPFQTLSEAVKLGISCILSSGQENCCLEGKELLKKMQEKAGEQIQILAGGGVNAQVIQKLYEETKITSYHMSGKITVESPMRYRRKEVSMGLPSFSEYEQFRTSQKKISEAKNVLEDL